MRTLILPIMRVCTFILPISRVCTFILPIMRVHNGTNVHYLIEKIHHIQQIWAVVTKKLFKFFLLTSLVNMFFFLSFFKILLQWQPC